MGALEFHQPPQRVVSLVPSLTESLFDLGLGEVLVGVTEYCVYPSQGEAGGRLAGLPRVGGPKNPRIEDILALKPDLVLANREETTRQSVEALEAAGIPVRVTFPKTVRQALDGLWEIAGMFQDQPAAMGLRSLEMAYDWTKTAAESGSPCPYFCPIWRDETQEGLHWWMTFNRHTYMHDLLGLMGGENLFSGRERRYPLAADLGLAEPEDPGERDTRYPCVILDEIRAANPHMILLPDEPFAFGETQLRELCELLPGTEAVRNGRVHLVDGSLVTWHGTRLGKALQELPELFMCG